MSKNTSPYLMTPVKSWYLDLWEARTVTSSDFDKIVTIPAAFNQRPDLLSFQEYGTPKLWWVFALRNPDTLIDPIADFLSGTEIYIPDNLLKK